MTSHVELLDKRNHERLQGKRFDCVWRPNCPETPVPVEIKKDKILLISFKTFSTKHLIGNGVVIDIYNDGDYVSYNTCGTGTITSVDRDRIICWLEVPVPKEG